MLNSVYYCLAQNIQMLLVFNGENTHYLIMFNYSNVFVYILFKGYSINFKSHNSNLIITEYVRTMLRSQYSSPLWLRNWQKRDL